MTSQDRRKTGPRQKKLIAQARQQHRDSEAFLKLLEHLSAAEALSFLGKSPSWLNNLRARDETFSQQVAILDRIQRGLDLEHGLGATAVRAQPARATARGQTTRQAQKARQNLVTLKQKEAFLQIYKETKRRSAAAERLGVSTLEVLHAMEIDKEFERDIENIRLSALWDAEDAMMERAAESGVDARFLLNKMAEARKKIPKRGKKPGDEGPSWAKTG